MDRRQQFCRRQRPRFIQLLEAEPAFASVASPFVAASAAAQALSWPGRAGKSAGEKVDEATRMSATPHQTGPGNLPEEPTVTVETLMSEVRYCVVYGELNERFNAAASKIVRAILLVSTYAAVGAGGLGIGFTQVKALAPHFPSEALVWIAGILGLLALAAKVAQKVWAFDVAEAQFRSARVKFEKLLGKGWKMTATQLSEELNSLRAEAPLGLSALADAAYNKTVEQIGHSGSKVRLGLVVRHLPGVLT